MSAIAITSAVMLSSGSKMEVQPKDEKQHEFTLYPGQLSRVQKTAAEDMIHELTNKMSLFKHRRENLISHKISLFMSICIVCLFRRNCYGCTIEVPRSLVRIPFSPHTFMTKFTYSFSAFSRFAIWLCNLLLEAFSF